jgi:hypothetical protein
MKYSVGQLVDLSKEMLRITSTYRFRVRGGKCAHCGAKTYTWYKQGGAQKGYVVWIYCSSCGKWNEAYEQRVHDKHSTPTCQPATATDDDRSVPEVRDGAHT